MSEPAPSFADAMAEGFAPLLAPVYDDIVAAIVAEDRAATSGTSWSDHARALAASAERQRLRIGHLNEDAALFNARYANVADEQEQRAAILDFAGKLGATRRQLRRDRRAFAAWFDGDAVLDRYRRRLGEAERHLAHAVERAGYMAARALEEDEVDADDPLVATDLADLLDACRRHRGDPRVREAAHRAMRHLAATHALDAEGFWVERALRGTRRAALDWRETAWTQCLALDVLADTSLPSLTATLDRLFADPPGEQDLARRDQRLFVYRHLVCLLADHPKLADWLSSLSLDREGAVRQVFAEALPSMPRERAEGFATRLRIDRDPQVRAAYFADPAALAETLGPERVSADIVRVMTREQDEFVLRMAVDASWRLCEWLRDHAPDAPPDHGPKLQRALLALRARVESPKIRRWASEAYERIWLLGDEEALAIATEARRAGERLKEGRSRRVAALGPHVLADPDKTGRALAVLAQDDFGYELTESERPLLQRGDRFRRRLWRILFEGNISATDKRQAHLHTTGRDYRSTIAAPAARMAELAPTKVPGEPLFQSEDGNWRNWLPLLDHVLSAIDMGKTVRIFTSEGVTTIVPPGGVVNRARAYWRMSRAFAHLADLRNRAGSAYVEELAKYGVAVIYTPYAAPEGLAEEQAETLPADPSVARFFSVGAVAMLPALWSDVTGYAATVFTNTLVQLGLFVIVVCLWFFGRHIWLGRQARRTRDAVALSLGGWGTRGKSGTERLKAGLVSALGAPFVSKTTGCEAMFLNGEPFGEVTEMFLFRPYDKATIWEQFNLIRLARRLRARVFLWECMGLNPSYVRVLQQDWMRDDIGTITNTYPDHEDVQGPAGRDIPIVMTEFIPQNSVCLTTEEEMLPILREGAQAKNTRLRSVNWRQAGLLHQTLLDRFPYAEHPYNIALVTAMGDELGLPPDFCVKEMSDRVVADLGVLKTYPRSVVDGRTLEYVMGNSANERFGAMGNWNRMGFADHDLEVDPEIFVSTVVNNRADRVPRSRVFARILVTDIAADRHVLIGSNIDGLLGFIDEEWDEYAASLTLASPDGAPLDLFDGWSKRQRVPLSDDALTGLLHAMLVGSGADVSVDAVGDARTENAVQPMVERVSQEHSAAIMTHYERMEGYHGEYLALREKIADASDPASLDAQVRAFLERVFKAKLLPIRDYYIKGEQIVRLVAQDTPPGLVNRIMGMQNIKGTGLDFVYRWQAWEAVAKACEQAIDPDPVVAKKGLAMLASFQEFGVLSERLVHRTIDELLQRDALPPGYTPAQAEAIVARLQEQIAAVEDASLRQGDGEAGGGWLADTRGWLLSVSEGLLDGGDAIRRRRRADRIYEAMIAEQISAPRAVVELKKLTSRQKGGWLGAAIGDRIGRLLPTRA